MTSSFIRRVRSISNVQSASSTLETPVNHVQTLACIRARVAQTPKHKPLREALAAPAPHRLRSETSEARIDVLHRAGPQALLLVLGGWIMAAANQRVPL